MPQPLRAREDGHVTATIAAPKATRPVRGRLVAGVATGLAHHLNLPVWVVRLAFVVLSFAGGIGIVLYAAFWAVLTKQKEAMSR